MSKIAWFTIGMIIVIAGGMGCTGEEGLLLPGRESDSGNLDGLTLVARLVHITDSHIVDEESPARFAGAQVVTSSAWRPYEAYATQLLDGIIRTVNRIHADGRNIDFLLNTGDICDNAQQNELAWFIAVMDGGLVDPLTGPDDREADARPDPLLDPHASFQAQGLYRAGEHGELPSIPWYLVVGNHDYYAIGVFPIVESADGSRTAPMPLYTRPGLVLPVRFDPLGSSGYGPITPADPGPPCFFETPSYVGPNSGRGYFRKNEYVDALSATVTEPAGHGFADLIGVTPVPRAYWYSVSPVAGLRLIGLDTTDRDEARPGYCYDSGALSYDQLAFLRSELDAAVQREELVIVASHHPTPELELKMGNEVVGGELRALLNEYPNVVLHFAGHEHRNRVTDFGGYLEVETCSTLDLPQEGRLIEIWRDAAGDNVVVSYEMFSHVDDTLPALGDDPLRELREEAQAIARGDQTATARQKRFDPSGADPSGGPTDRQGVIVLER